MKATGKESVKLRRRKLASGDISLYLDIYQNGTRSYDYLKLYLHDKPADARERTHNKDTLKAAEAIQAKKVLSLQSAKYGVDDGFKQNYRFVKFFEECARNSSASTDRTWDAVLRQLKLYCDHDLTFHQVDSDFIKGFVKHLDGVKSKFGKPLSQGTKFLYMQKFKSAITKAIKDRYLANSSLSTPIAYKKMESERKYLTIDQLKVLAKTDFDIPVLKNAFLFSCLTGLRYSDISTLTWSQLKQFDSGYRIIFRQVKTRNQEYLDISTHAVPYMGTTGKMTDLVFEGLPAHIPFSAKLQRWCAAAGISELITFHSGRHTFAVMMLTIGTDLYTLSKLLGHRDITTTQIYAKIVDKVKQEAVRQIPDIAL